MATMPKVFALHNIADDASVFGSNPFVSTRFAITVSVERVENRALARGWRACADLQGFCAEPRLGKPRASVARLHGFSRAACAREAGAGDVPARVAERRSGRAYPLPVALGRERDLSLQLRTLPLHPTCRASAR